MGYSGNTQRVHRIELSEYDGSDNWVDIRAARSAADVEAMRAAGIPKGTPVRSVDGQISVQIAADQFDYLAVRILRFKLFIRAWSLKAEDDDPAPMAVNEESFRSLSPELVEWLTDEIERYYESRIPSRDFSSASNGKRS